MNGETEKAMTTLLGGKQSSANAGEIDYKSRCEELERQLASAKVEQGRVKTLDAKTKELEKELSELRAQRESAEVLSGLSDDERESLPPGVANIAVKAADLAARRERQATDERIAILEREREEERKATAEIRQREFVRKIKSSYPGFMESIEVGGDKHEPWNAYLENNSDTICSAIAKCDFPVLEYHIKMFYKTVLQIPIPSATGGTGTGAPSPETIGGANRSLRTEVPGAKKIYTQEEYDALTKKAMELRAAGKFAAYGEITDELDAALAEDRISD